MNILVGIHAVREALKAGRPIDRVHVLESAGARLGEILELCRRNRIPVRREPREQIDRLAGGGVHQGVVAMVAAQHYADLDSILAGLDHPGLLIALDGVEDPHNLGAIIRSAHAAGADAVLIPERRAAGLTPAAAKAAAGALEYLPVVRVTNLNRTIEELKKQGFWVTGLDERGAKPFWEMDYKGPTVLVFGAEGHGLHEHLRDKCDYLGAIPTAGKIASLNVSVSAGIVLFEVLRQRQSNAEEQKTQRKSD